MYDTKNRKNNGVEYNFQLPEREKRTTAKQRPAMCFT